MTIFLSLSFAMVSLHHDFYTLFSEKVAFYAMMNIIASKSRTGELISSPSEDFFNLLWNQMKEAVRSFYPYKSKKILHFVIVTYNACSSLWGCGLDVVIYSMVKKKRFPQKILMTSDTDDHQKKARCLCSLKQLFI